MYPPSGKECESSARVPQFFFRWVGVCSCLGAVGEEKCSRPEASGVKARPKIASLLQVQTVRFDCTGSSHSLEDALSFLLEGSDPAR